MAPEPNAFGNPARRKQYIQHYNRMPLLFQPSSFSTATSWFRFLRQTYDWRIHILSAGTRQ
jgi:hypothetical protein